MLISFYSDIRENDLRNFSPRMTAGLEGGVLVLMAARIRMAISSSDSSIT